MLERQSIQVLHRDEGLAVLLVNLVDRADVWMVQRGRGLRFALEAGQSLRVLGGFVRQELEGYKAMEFRIFRFVHHTHPTAAQLLHDAVVRDGLANHLRECYGVRSGMSMYGLTAVSPTPSWLPSGSECRGRRLSRKDPLAERSHLSAA